MYILLKYYALYVLIIFFKYL